MILAHFKVILKQFYLIRGTFNDKFNRKIELAEGFFKFHPLYLGFLKKLFSGYGIEFEDDSGIGVTINMTMMPDYEKKFYDQYSSFDSSDTFLSCTSQPFPSQGRSNTKRLFRPR